ncbi:MAG: PH domain-containing protein [Bacteroidia bacterium]|nr:PH domain-containing protein [Bacteroidia bacterium]
MSYIKENLSKGERVIYTTTLHWVLFLESVSILLTGLVISFLGARYKDVLGSTTYIVQYLALFVLIFGGIKFLLELIRHRTSEFVVTTERVLIKVGVIHRSSTSMPLSKIESVEIDQSIIGRLFGFGSIHITGTGTAESKFDLISDPHKFRRKMLLASNSATEEEREREVYTPPRRRRRRRR